MPAESRPAADAGNKGGQLSYIFVKAHAFGGENSIALQQLGLTFAYCTLWWHDCTFKWMENSPDDKELADWQSNDNELCSLWKSVTWL